MKLYPLVLMGAIGLAACTAPDLATRSQTQSVITAPDVTAPVLRHDIRAVHVHVPRSLRVSEANLYYPIADIVWRGEARGDRHAQVEAIVAEAFATGTEGMNEGTPVIVEAEVTRFHSVTEKTRYSIGGTHAIHFTLTLRDPATGAVVAVPQKVVADIAAAGGQRALEEESRGLTQRVVIVRELAQAVRTALSGPMPPAPVPEATDGPAQAAPAIRIGDNLRLGLVALPDAGPRRQAAH